MKLFPRRCKSCGRWSFSVKRRRQDTAYVDEESNFITCCASCFDAVQEQWAEQWSEYWRSV